VSLDPRTPVVVAAAAVTHHPGDGFVPTSATALMLEAAEAAVAATGVADELGRSIGEVLVPHGTWPESDPGRAVCAALGAPAARSVMGELGVLQHSLMARAARSVADGSVTAALVLGGENRWSGVVAAKGGAAVPDPPAIALDGSPDEVLRPAEMVISAMEIERDLTTAAHQYAIIESALRHAAGRDADEHQRFLGELWARFAAVAAETSSAWDRRGLSSDEITEVSDTNRLIAAPYPKWLVSQWNVDQAAALVLTTVGTAERLGVPRDQWVFPLAMAESNLVVTLPERAELDRWPAMGVCGRTALGAAGVTVDEIGPVDLYSCFPAAVQVTAAELGLGLDRDLTLTGGMTFGGGPYDNYVLQAAVAMVERLRADPPGVVGLTSAVSGLLTKPAVTLWSAAEPRREVEILDVTTEADAASARRPVDPDGTGPARVVGHTVVPARDGTLSAIAVLDLETGARTVARCHDGRIAALLAEGDHVGHRVSVTAPGEFRPGA
jgi:acetyl-CoA C-acetyltransferase